MMMINTQHKKQQQHGTCSPRMLKFSTALLGMCLAGYIVGPPLYWHISESVNSSVSQTSCPSCHCDCLDQPLFSLPQGLNASFLTDCMKHDADEAGEESEESEKNFAEILSGELRQKEAEALANQHRADVALLEAKKMANQYQKDADKCNNGMETCEDARERAEDALDAQRELTTMWEMRARHRGWKSELSESSDNKLPDEEARSLESGNKVQDGEAEAGSVQNAEAVSFNGNNLVHDTEAEAGNNVVQDARADSFEDSTKIPDADAESSDKAQNAEAEAETIDSSNNAEDANAEAETLESNGKAETETLESSNIAEDANAEAFENSRKVQDAEAESHTETMTTEKR